MITAVVPISPIPSHPDTTILQTTLDSIRHHLPDAEVILTFDGVRPEQEDRRADYEEHIRRALWLADHHYGNMLPLVFDRHLHQVGMMRAALPKIDTTQLLYVEADAPLVTDEWIDFSGICDFIASGRSNLVRLHHEAVIPQAHEHMMHGRTHWGSKLSGETTFVITSQWSQRPHVASKAFYRRIMDGCFTPDAKSFIEDKMHGVVDEAFNIDGIYGWDQYRLHIWDPDNGNMKRTYHLDGRAGGPKFDDAQVY